MKQPTGPAFIFEATRYHNLIKTDRIVLWMILPCMEPNRLWSLRRISHVISKISLLLCCLKVRKTDLVERFYPWEKDCPAHIMNQIRCDILIPESWYPSQQALCDSKWILVAKNRRAVVGGRRQNQYNCQCWSIRSVVRQGSGSGLFRSQQFGTDQICYPCHILTRTVGQEAQSPPRYHQLKLKYTKAEMTVLLLMFSLTDIWLIFISFYHKHKYWNMWFAFQ